MFDNAIDNFSINIEITMSNMISNANHIFPRYFWTFRKQFSFRHVINLMNALSNSLNQHTTGSKFLHTIRRKIIIIRLLYISIPFLQLTDCSLNLLKNAKNSLFFI